MTKYYVSLIDFEVLGGVSTMTMFKSLVCMRFERVSNAYCPLRTELLEELIYDDIFSGKH